MEVGVAGAQECEEAVSGGGSAEAEVEYDSDTIVVGGWRPRKVERK